MKKIISCSLYVVIILLIAFISVLSIKKFFDKKDSVYFSDILATNFVTDFVSFNEVLLEENFLVVENKEELVEESVISEDLIINENVDMVSQSEDSDIHENIIESSINSESSTEVNTDILFDGLTEIELIAKLDKSLKNELSGTSINFVEYYKNTGLDPYLAVAIVLHETGCTWNCSNLVKECYNFGGMKGGDTLYKDTSYSCYATKEEGINVYLNMLYNNYYSKGLTTAELINPKYAASLEWAGKINNYISKIKNN